jgi:predicted SnoaL-like aldol condensation-catalyzing enzyme
MPSLSPAGTINVASRTGPSREQSRRVARAGRRLDDGEYVVNHALITDDDGPTAVRFDLWRIENQRFVQHWADEEPWVPETANGHTQIDGTRQSTTTRTPLRPAGSPTARCRAFLSTATPRHSMTMWQGNVRAAQPALRRRRDWSGCGTHRPRLTGNHRDVDGIRQIVAEGSFAYLRSEGTFAGQPFVFHALFRVADGRCVEHWDVMVPRQ